MGRSFIPCTQSHTFVQESQISRIRIQEVSLFLISHFFPGTYLLVLKLLFCFSFSLASFFLQAGNLCYLFSFGAVSLATSLVTETDENIQKSMFKNQEDVVVSEAELALLASVPVQHLRLSQTAIDPEFQQGLY